MCTNVRRLAFGGSAGRWVGRYCSRTRTRMISSFCRSSFHFQVGSCRLEDTVNSTSAGLQKITTPGPSNTVFIVLYSAQHAPRKARSCTISPTHSHTLPHASPSAADDQTHPSRNPPYRPHATPTRPHPTRRTRKKQAENANKKNKKKSRKRGRTWPKPATKPKRELKPRPAQLGARAQLIYTYLS